MHVHVFMTLSQCMKVKIVCGNLNVWHTDAYRSNEAMNTLTHPISLKTVYLVLTLVPSIEWAVWYSEWTRTDLCLWTVQSRQSSEPSPPPLAHFDKQGLGGSHSEQRGTPGGCIVCASILL